MSLIVPFVKNVLGELGMGDAGADEEEAGGCSSRHFFFLFFSGSGIGDKKEGGVEYFSFLVVVLPVYRILIMNFLMVSFFLGMCF